MKIEQIRILPLVVDPPAGGWPQGQLPARNDYTLVEVLTDEGICGLGSVYTSAKLVEASLELLEPLWRGEIAIEPARVSEKMHQSTFWQGRGGAVTHTISGIDIALWDLFGQATGQPVSRLLGGRYREQIKPYASLSMSQPGDLAEHLEAALARGFKAVKIGWGPFGRVSNKKDEELVPVQDEIDFMKNFIFLQKIRFGDNLKINISDNSSNGYLPPLALQILVENAIKHNVVSEQYPLSILVHLTEDYCTVENTIKEKLAKDSTGIGLSNLKARYQYLSKKEVSIENDGTNFKVHVPILFLEK